MAEFIAGIFELILGFIEHRLLRNHTDVVGSEKFNQSVREMIRKQKP